MQRLKLYAMFRADLCGNVVEPTGKKKIPKKYLKKPEDQTFIDMEIQAKLTISVSQ